MRVKPLSIFLTTVILFGASALFAEPLALPTNSPAQLSQTPMGALQSSISDIYSEENQDNFSSCDFQNRKRLLEIAKVLDAKEQEITQYSKSTTAFSEATKFEGFGDFHFQKSSDSAPTSQWIKYTNAWVQVFNQFESLRTHSVNAQWVKLNNFFRGQLYDDDLRLGAGKFMGIHRYSEAMVGSIVSKLDHCVSAESCTDPQLSKKQKQFLQSSRLYSEYSKRFASVFVSDERKRIELKTFQRLFSEQARLFGVKKNPTIRVEGDTLIVPLDLSVFGPDSGKMITFIENEWNIDPVYKIRIQPVSAGAEGYKALVDKKGGGRALVSSKRKTIELQNYGSLKTIAHEFGHVLGFADTYFTTWDSVGCKYWIEWNPGDLMSGSSTGAVLSSHWDQLKKTYSK